MVTDCGGVPELITHGVNGMLAPVGDIEAQAAAVIGLLSSSVRYERMAAAARRNAESRFCASLIIPQYEQHYARLLEQHS